MAKATPFVPQGVPPRRKRSRWLIERSAGGRLLVSPVGSARLFHEKFAALLEAPAWRGVGS